MTRYAKRKLKYSHFKFAPIHWMGPIRYPNWSTSGMRVTLLYIYASVVHQGYLCKFWEPFCGHSSTSQEFVTVGINLGIVWSLFYYWTSKLINLLLFPSFPNSHHLRANFPNYKGPQIQMIRKIRHNKTWPILLLPVEETRAVKLTSPASRHA
jgi:hypothetical protein